MKVVSLIDNNISEVEVVTTSGGFANNVFFTNIDSDIIGYKKLSNTADTSVTNLTTTVIDTDGQKIARSYLFDLPIGVDTHDAGIWSIFYNAYVDSAVGDTRLIFEPFMRASNGNETTLFTEISPEINNTTMQRIEPPPINQPQFTVDANSRFGVRIKVSTTSNIQKTVHTLIGGENASYFNSPIAQRHTQLRGLNDDTNFLHVTSTEKNTWNAKADLNHTQAISTITNLQTELNSKSNITHNHTLASLSERSYNSLTDKPAVQTTAFYSQTDFNIDGNNGTYFLITSSVADPTITLSNITIGVMYYIRVLNQGSYGMTITLPNTADIRPSNVISIPTNTYKTLAMVYDGTLREWQVSETGASI